MHQVKLMCILSSVLRSGGENNSIFSCVPKYEIAHLNLLVHLEFEYM